jgi:uncharacterized protein YbaP (TraB family)
MARGAAFALALLAAGIVGGCHPAPEKIDAHPALWRVRDADTTIWLFGTIHVLPDGVHWQTPAVRRAMDSADALVMELPDDPGGTSRAFTEASAATGLRPVAERIAPDKRPALAAALAAGGLDASAVDGKKSWAAAFIIAGASDAAKGITREHGIEATLAARFAGRHRPRSGIETVAGQFAIFDGLPEAAQRVLLERAIEDAANGGGEYRVTLDAWARGDVSRMAATLDPAFRAAPALEQTLATGRNRRWANAIEKRLRRPGSILLAVGTGHLVGPHSVIAILRARGFKVERVE